VLGRKRRRMRAQIRTALGWHLELQICKAQAFHACGFAFYVAKLLIVTKGYAMKSRLHGQ
jgi:hypothetical protein